MNREALVIVAAGTGTRLGPAGGRPKALVTVRGVTLLELALQSCREAGLDHLVVVHTPGARAPFEDIARRYGVVSLVPGGESRTESVRAGVEALPEDVEVVGIHDAARALTPPEVIRAAFDAIGDGTVAVAPGTAVADTLKRVGGDNSVLGTVDRRGLQAVGTPQVFRAEVLRPVLAHGGSATDDLALVEEAIADGRAEGRVGLVAGSPLGFKVTFPADLELAATLLDATGIGTGSGGSRVTSDGDVAAERSR